MKHQNQTQLKRKNDIIAIAVIKGLVKEGKIPQAIETAEKRKFTPEQFGKIANMTELSAEEIYKQVLI